MPVPRVFVSSTCYDLQEIRQNLRRFIQEFAYEPVMSEFGDIFYEYDHHVQDSCVREVEKCQLFLLIIGNNYGSFYHSHQSSSATPDSVTLIEFKRALSVNIPKHIFINRFVHYDFLNYRRALDEKLKAYFDQNEVVEDDIQYAVQTIRKEFDDVYPFPQRSYRYIFYFLDLINELKSNNAIFPFETFKDIQDQLRKQWAGYMYERLSDKRSEANETTIKEISERIDRIETLLKSLVTKATAEKGTIKLDIEKIAGDLAKTNLEEAQELVSESLNDIMYDSYEDVRGIITEYLTQEKVTKWLDGLEGLLRKYKWSKTIPFTSLWPDFHFRYYTRREQEIMYKSISKLYALYSGLPKEEQLLLANTVLLLLGQIIKPDADKQTEKPTGSDIEDDEIPF
jgi:hypothetical protein